jgi:hypothetical protein
VDRVAAQKSFLGAGRQSAEWTSAIMSLSCTCIADIGGINPLLLRIMGVEACQKLVLVVDF